VISKEVVVVTGMGRSGSKFLSTLLNQARNAVSKHEFIGDMTFVSLSYYKPQHPLVAAQLREGFRSVRRDASSTDRCVVVEPGLRYAIPVVREVSPDALCLHLVRNGRAVVRSMQRRKFLTKRDPHLPCIPHDPSGFERWQQSDRFECLCWYWSDSVRRLLDQGVKTIHLERLVSDYDYLDAQLLQPAGITLSRSEWISQRDRRINRSGMRLRLKSWMGRRPRNQTWSNDRERQFREVCGDVMEELNYS